MPRHTDDNRSRARARRKVLIGGAIFLGAVLLLVAVILLAEHTGHPAPPPHVPNAKCGDCGHLFDIPPGAPSNRRVTCPSCGALDLAGGLRERAKGNIR